MRAKYHHLTLEERTRFDKLHFRKNISIPRCARILHRDSSTFDRELGRNKW